MQYAGNTDLVILDDLEQGNLRRLTFEPSRDSFPIWSFDGRIAFASTRDDGNLNLYSKPADGSGEATRLTLATQQAPNAFMPGEQSLFFSQIRPGKGSDVGLLSLDQGSVDWLIASDAHESHLVVSPDGRWGAYTSDESGQIEVWVRPLPIVGETRYQVSRGGGFSPQWGPSSQEVFYQTPADAEGLTTLMAVQNDTDVTFRPGSPVPLFQGLYLASASSPW